MPPEMGRFEKGNSIRQSADSILGNPWQPAAPQSSFCTPKWLPWMHTLSEAYAGF